MKKTLLFGFVVLSACTKPDVKALNSMPGQTAAMSKKMDGTNDALHKSVLSAALTEMDKPENQALIFPIPTGLMAAGQAFAETATTKELMEFFYLRIKELNEVVPLTGLDKDGSPLVPTDADLSHFRLQKMSKLFSLIVIAGFTPDFSDQQNPPPGKVLVDRISEIKKNVIQGSDLYQETGLNFLALRAVFIREILLKLKMNLTTDNVEVLSNSGQMSEAVRLLTKLDDISSLPYADRIQVHIQEKSYNLVTFDEAQDASGRQQTAQLWQVALDKAKAGQTNFKPSAWTSNSRVDKQTNSVEAQKQKVLIHIMDQHVSHSS